MSTYTPTLGDTIYTGANAATEDLSRVGGFIAGCGEAALLVVLNAVKGAPTTPSDVTALIKQAVNAGQVTGGLAQSGESSPANLEALANSQGVSLQSGDYHALLAQYAGVKPVIVGVSNARAFGGADSNVFGHYVTVVGKTATGNYVVSDPNTPESQAGKFVTYTPAQINAAQPFWSAVPGGAILGGVGGIGGIGGNILNLVLPDWINQLGGRITAFTNTGWANPLRIVKFMIGFAIIGFVVAFVLFEGAAQVAGTGQEIGNHVVEQGTKIAKVAALFS